jgi:hypothetical protein
MHKIPPAVGNHLGETCPPGKDLQRRLFIKRDQHIRRPSLQMEAPRRTLHPPVVGRAPISAADDNGLSPLGSHGLEQLHQERAEPHAVAAGAFEFPEAEMLRHGKIIQSGCFFCHTFTTFIEKRLRAGIVVLSKAKDLDFAFVCRPEYREGPRFCFCLSS